MDRNMHTDIIGCSTHLKLGWVSHCHMLSRTLHGFTYMDMSPKGLFYL